MSFVIPLLLIVLIGVGAVAFLRQGWRAARRRREAPRALSDRYWAVQLIVPDPHRCCLFARTLAGRTLPIAQAPPLPLDGCVVVHCRCRYRYLPNRRSGRDRRRFRVVRSRDGERRLRGERRGGLDWGKKADGKTVNRRQY